MSQTILFSPIGGTDPMAFKNHRDGSMLHICRKYKPNVVYLYMSEEMLQHQVHDDRYRRSLKHLEELENFTMEIHELKHPELKDVHKFDDFYNIFHDELEKLRHKYPNDKILVNVSSGTPAMKSALLVLVTLGEMDFVPVQVATPIRAANYSNDDYPIDEIWNDNPDNKSETYEDRCEEVQCPTLSEIKQEENIKSLLDSYDYHAALALSKKINKKRRKYYQHYLEMANFRSILRYNQAISLEKQNPLGVEVFPVREKKYIACFEYALSVMIKQKQKNFSDFVRSLSPLIIDLYWMILEKQCGINKYTYCSYDNMWHWDKAKLRHSDIIKIVGKRAVENGPVYSGQLVQIINSKTPNKKELHKLVSQARQIEKKVRNEAAHEIVSLDDGDIKNKTGFRSEGIIEMIKQLFPYTGVNISENAWNAYETMNEAIKKKIDEGGFLERA